MPSIEATGFTSTDLDALDNLFGEPPSLSELGSQIGEMTDEDFLVSITLRIPPEVNEKWQAARLATGEKGIEADILVIQAAFDALTDGTL